MIKLYNVDCMEFLDKTNTRFKLIFLDPPDNIGLNYGQYNDKRPDSDYYNWLELLLLKTIPRAETVWLSYYWKHDLELTYRIRNILKFRHPVHRYRKILWRYTFGQYNKNDFASGFRYMIRLDEPSTEYNEEAIFVESERQRLGDSRASEKGRLPDDVWDIPRVTGNSHERRVWHPTQHPEELMERILEYTGGPVLDCFAGSGTTMIVAKRLGIDCFACEIDSDYCKHLKAILPC